MLARAEEQIGDVVESRQLLVRHVAEEMHVRGAEPRDERVQHREVSLEAAVRPDEQQARTRVVFRSVGVEGADHALELLVRDDTSHEHHVDPLVVEVRGEPAVRRHIQVGEVGDDRQDVGSPETERLELGAVVVRIAERDVAAIDVGGELAPAAKTQLDQVLVDADEILGRRDVVIDQRHPAREGVSGARRSRSNREVMDQDVLRTDAVDHVPVVERERLEPRIGCLDEDLGVESRRAQHALDPEDLMADRIPVAQRGEDLMHAWRSARRSHAVMRFWRSPSRRRRQSGGRRGPPQRQAGRAGVSPSSREAVRCPAKRSRSEDASACPDTCAR